MIGHLNIGDLGSFLVIGASGMIGHSIWKKLSPSLRSGTFYNYPRDGLMQLDIRDRNSTHRFIQQMQPTVIFQVAALPNVDWCETHRDECWATNVIGTENLIQAAKEVGAKFVFFSSDYVFDGVNGPYYEEDQPCPINIYGEAKFVAEQRIQNQLTDYLILRVTVVYGWELQRKNFVIRLIQKLRNGESIQVPVDQIGNPTYVDNLSEVILELVQRDQRGIFHVAGSERLSRYAFACLVADVFELDSTKIIPLSTAELHQNAHRPLNAGMCSEKVQSVVSIPLLSPKEGLLCMKKQKHQ
ncbi:MAG: SDR family oxidoreductase [Chitinivibrionales bacterium]|nr:SDR family oxidoreductase [Chitinivibrionales bacterium]